MSHYRIAALAALVTAGAVFTLLVAAAGLQVLVALVLALAFGGVIAAAFSRRPMAPRSAEQDSVIDVVPEPAPEPEPVYFQTQSVAGVRLRSAVADYSFIFTASVRWLSTKQESSGTSEIAVNEVIRRARGITERWDPNEAAVAASELAANLGALQTDPSGQVQVRAESVYLQLSSEDQQRLDEFARLRKDEGLWEYQRRQQVNKRQYLHADVLKDSGSAVVWWLAQHEDNPQQVAENIGVLTRLAQAANNFDETTPAAPASEPVTPLTSAERFDAFLESLDPTPDDKARLFLTDLVARFVDKHDPEAADEMRRRHGKPEDGGSTSESWGYPDETGY